LEELTEMREDLQVHSAKTSDNNCSLQPIEELRVNSWTVLGNLLNRHPYLRDRPNFEEQQRRAQSYIALKDAQHRDDLPRHLTIADIARDLDLPFNVVSYWLDDRSQPALFHTLIAHETARREHEALSQTKLGCTSLTQVMCTKLSDRSEALKNVPLKTSHKPSKPSTALFPTHPASSSLNSNPTTSAAPTGSAKSPPQLINTAH
jgi:hypothetical protein